MKHAMRAASGQERGFAPEKSKKAHTCVSFCKFLCLLVLCACLLSACGEGGRVPNVAALFGTAFSAEVEITKNGQELLARIEASAVADGQRSVCVRYLSGGVLCGVTVEGRVEAGGGVGASCIGECHVTLGELVLSLPEGTADGLLDPVTALLELSAASSVQQGSDGSFTLTFDGDRALVVGSDGTPTAFASPSLSMRILEFAWEARM